MNNDVPSQTNREDKKQQGLLGNEDEKVSRRLKVKQRKEELYKNGHIEVLVCLKRRSVSKDDPVPNIYGSRRRRKNKGLSEICFVLFCFWVFMAAYMA